MKTLSLAEADCGYRGVPVLSGVSIDIEENDICLVNGPNGSGKTTLALSLLGLLPLIKGKRFSSFSTPSYVPQAGRFDTQYPLTLETLVAMGLQEYSTVNPLKRWSNRKSRRAAISEALGRTGLSDKGSHLFYRSSGGEFQRALIARALVSGPDLLFLDEPFANIDRRGKSEIKELLLRESRERGITLIIIDHHENVDFCSNCLEIVGGKVVRNGID